MIQKKDKKDSNGFENKKTMKKILLLIPVAILVACGGNRKNTNEEGELTRAAYTPERNLVDTIVLREQTFHLEIVANGRLRALRKSELRFLSGGQVAAIEAVNGQAIAAGQLIARLDPYTSEQRMIQARLQADRSYLDLLEAVIDFGYPADTTGVPKDILQRASVRSGYLTAQSSYELALNEYRNLDLRAPFAGKVANLTKKVYEQTGSGEVFCTLIDDSAFEVEFNLLESEVPFVRTGQTIHVAPFNQPDDSFTGRITQINPLVDNRGQITVRAEIANRGGHLLEGMNVKVVIKEALPRQWVVPKDAVVVRDNQEVLFRFGPDGRAMWTYVEILMSNSTSHVVAANRDRGAELNLGDLIITSGNLNLADGSTVEARP